MKLTKETLKRIILEELNVVSEEEKTPEVTKEQDAAAKEIAKNKEPFHDALFKALDADPEVQNMLRQQNESNDPFEDFPVATTYAATMSPVMALATGPLLAKVAAAVGVTAGAAGVGTMAIGALVPLALAYLYDKKGGRI
tara:strand:- start:655 stop:1074 length:420 start_codon:yes stop_codon:yes gene_type:complete